MERDKALSQGGDFFLGDSFADVMSTPFVQQGIVALKQLRGYSIQISVPTAEALAV